MQVAIKSNASDPSQGVWAHLKYEGGVHRVQRVPVTETQGRIHTSAVTVAVLPEAEEVRVEAQLGGELLLLGDPLLLATALDNLVRNAMEAILEAGRHDGR